MTYVRARPHPALRGVVASYSGYEEWSATPVSRRQAPSGGVTLILAWGGPLQLTGADGGTHGAFLAGMHDTAVITTFTGHQQGVQVDLTPLGVGRLLARPGEQLARHNVAVGDLGTPLAELPDRLADLPDWPARFALVDTVLRRLLDRSPREPDPAVAHAWTRLSDAGGRVPVSDLAGELGWSRRHLLTRFRSQIGLAPTTAGRVLRFRRASRMLVPGEGPLRRPTTESIADVAARSGYADHSHLVREFRALAGCTPSAFVAEWAGAFPDVQDGPVGGS